MAVTKPDLFQSFSLKGLELKNRIVMAPMTRLRALEDGTPSDIMSEYYSQRASAGLIVTECTMVSPLSHGYMHCPGMYKSSHVLGWSRVTQAVHENGGLIFLQIWHSGRVCHPYLLAGQHPIAPSAVAGQGDLHTPKGKVDLPTPRQIDLEEIPKIIDEFSIAAEFAKQANFDGVEIHGAFGYLIDQFLQDVSNHRSDDYGGSIKNRVRFLEEVVSAVSNIWPSRTGIKLSPSNTFYGMGDSDPTSLFRYAIEKLNEFDLAYVHLMEPSPGDIEKGVPIENVLATFRGDCSHPLITNGGYDDVKAELVLSDMAADLVSFGRPFISNPDLVYRYKNDIALNDSNPQTFYGRGPESATGYTDYEFASKARQNLQ
ncbi:MAG: alkene reductase [Candidatus Obscuribacterales bacterium]|nr:alkene reductase [Candidatus Obscuribacterales bacterium]